MKQGKSLELLIAGIEKLFNYKNNPAIEVISPCKIRDNITGKLREHDVCMEIRSNYHSLITAFECRDRSRPVGVNQIEAFKNKCEATNINQGIIVSTSGFYMTAKKRRNFMGLDAFL